MSSSDSEFKRGLSPEEFAAAVSEHRRRTGHPHPLIRLARHLARQAALRNHEAALAEAQRRKEAHANRHGDGHG